MSLYKEEIFGPVVSIKTFQTEEEALALANDSRYTYTQQTMRPMKLKKKTSLIYVFATKLLKKVSL